MESTLKNIFKQDIKHQTSKYNNVLTLFNQLVENGFDKSSTKVECQMIELLSQMIWIKDEIKELEIALMLEKEELKC